MNLKAIDMMELSQPQLFQLLSIRSAVGLEIKGLKHSRGSVYAHAKQLFGIKGSRETVYTWLKEMAELQKDLRKYTFMYDEGVRTGDRQMVMDAEDAIPSIRDAIEGMIQ